MSDNTNKEFKGYNGTLILTDTGVIIKRGAKGFLLGGGMLRGDKTIPYSSIVAVQLKKAGMTAGYIQLTLKGGSEAKSGLFQSTTDENSINFHSAFGGNNNELFREAKRLIGERINAVNSPVKNSGLDDLEKLTALKEKGIINEEEFNAKKRQLLGL
ncbi:MAG: SHOCT domain-containing protein [Candidatus Liptonbacteria bacterium]|nr:SHOCT domain-containing protein [Candidatus Liptonbacteria bacterium]